MTSIKISNQLSTTSTTINNIFIDRYMPAANGEFVKVYLYLIRMASCGQCPTIADMADALNNTESDILRALKYWQKQGLLVVHCNTMNDLEFIELLPIPEEVTQPYAPTFNVVTPNKAGYQQTSAALAPAATVKSSFTGNTSNTSGSVVSLSSARTSETVSSLEKKQPVVAMPPSKPNYDMREIEHHMEHSDMKHLPYEAEILLGKPISPEDLKTLYYLHDKLGFSADVISYLIEYCVLHDKKSMRYIEKTALNWHENHIRSVEDARHYSASYTKLNAAIMRAMGLTGGSLAEAQLKYVTKWTSEYGMDETLIVEACNRTMLQTGNASFPYTDKILTNWHNAGITCLAQVEQHNKEYRASHSANYKQASRKATTSSPNQFHDFIQGEEVDYDAIIPKTVQHIED